MVRHTVVHDNSGPTMCMKQWAYSVGKQWSNSAGNSGPTVYSGSGPTVGTTTVGLQCMTTVVLQWAYSGSTVLINIFEYFDFIN